MNKIAITLKRKPRKAALNAMYDRGMSVPEPWFGPTFEGNLMKSFSSGFLWVLVYNDPLDCENNIQPIATYAYPLDSIARLKIE